MRLSGRREAMIIVATYMHVPCMCHACVMRVPCVCICHACAWPACMRPGCVHHAHMQWSCNGARVRIQRTVLRKPSGNSRWWLGLHLCSQKVAGTRRP